MSKEIELKAHIDNPDILLEKIRKDYYINNEYYSKKYDVYFFNPILNQSFRVREQIEKDTYNFEIKKTIYTVKEKIIENGIEQNIENEVELDIKEFSASLIFFEKLGFKESHRKNKEGYSFNFTKFDTPLHIELLKVNDLGWFFEIEFVTDINISNEMVDNLVKYLYKTLDYFDIPYSNIEKRYYSQMILD